MLMYISFYCRYFTAIPLVMADELNMKYITGRRVGSVTTEFLIFKCGLNGISAYVKAVPAW